MHSPMIESIARDLRRAMKIRRECRCHMKKMSHTLLFMYGNLFALANEQAHDCLETLRVIRKRSKNED